MLRISLGEFHCQAFCGAHHVFPSVENVRSVVHRFGLPLRWKCIQLQSTFVIVIFCSTSGEQVGLLHRLAHWESGRVFHRLSIQLTFALAGAQAHGVRVQFLAVHSDSWESDEQGWVEVVDPWEIWHIEYSAFFPLHSSRTTPL